MRNVEWGVIVPFGRSRRRKITATHLIEREAIDGKRRIGLDEPRDAILADPQDLRIDKGARLGQPVAEEVGLLVELEGR